MEGKCVAKGSSRTVGYAFVYANTESAKGSSQ